MYAIHHQVKMMNAFVVSADKIGEINRSDFIAIGAQWPGFGIDASAAIIGFKTQIAQKFKRTCTSPTAKVRPDR